MKRIVIMCLLSAFVIITAKAYTSSNSYLIYTTSGQKNYLIYQSGYGWGDAVNTFVYCSANAKCTSTAKVQLQTKYGNPVGTNEITANNGEIKSQSKKITGLNLYKMYFSVYTTGGLAMAYSSW